MPISVPMFGRVTTLREAEAIHETFSSNIIRDLFMEQALGKTHEPVVVDCGINVGITVRWWFHLQPTARVFGIDMMEEAQGSVRKWLDNEKHRLAYTGITAPLSANDGDEITIRYSDPLDSWNRIENKRPTTSARTLQTSRLDTLLAPYSLKRIDLLKIDIEGHANKALLGATRTLAITQNICFEHHSEEEIGEVTTLLIKDGFQLRRSCQKILWFTRI